MKGKGRAMFFKIGIFEITISEIDLVNKKLRANAEAQIGDNMIGISIGLNPEGMVKLNVGLSVSESKINA
jgi:hypothetical protein